jgi:hypothetical protein
MAIDHFMITPVTIVHPGTLTDRYGDTRPDWAAATETETTAWLTQLEVSEQLLRRDAEVADHRLFVRPDVTVAAGDRVVGDGLTFEVVGPPHKARTPTAVHHIEAMLRSVVG